MTTIAGGTATAAWNTLIEEIATTGNLVQPRGSATREMLSVTSIISMRFPVVRSEVRKLGYRFMAAEAAWILSGDNRVRSIAPYSRHISSFSDDGVRFFGAYGPPIRDQLGHVVRSLESDPSSRQAVLTIWRPNPPGTRDVPCTISLQWMIRSDQLHCFATMRSSDAWLGWPYDVFNFSMVSKALALEMGNRYPLGNLYLTAASQHLYDRDFAAARLTIGEKIPHERKPQLDEVVPPDAVTTPDKLVERLWFLANHDGVPHD